MGRDTVKPLNLLPLSYANWNLIFWHIAFSLSSLFSFESSSKNIEYTLFESFNIAFLFTLCDKGEHKSFTVQ